MNESKIFEKALSAYQQDLEALRSQRSKLAAEYEALKALGIKSGKPSWSKQGRPDGSSSRYLRIYQPKAKGAKKRVFEYVGNNPEKVKAAEQALERFARCKEIEAQIESIDDFLAKLLDWSAYKLKGLVPVVRSNI